MTGIVWGWRQQAAVVDEVAADGLLHSAAADASRPNPGIQLPSLTAAKQSLAGAAVAVAPFSRRHRHVSQCLRRAIHRMGDPRNAPSLARRAGTSATAEPPAITAASNWPAGAHCRGWPMVRA